MSHQPLEIRASHIGKLAAAILLLAATLMAAASPAHAEGGDRVEVGVGFFYGTFNQSPNVAMLVGGRAEDFCEANPDQPFDGEPGTALAQIRERNDGSVKIKVNSDHQPFHLYYIDFAGAPPWIFSVCEEYFATGETPEPFASGHARLRVRVTDFGQGNLDIFNGAKGWAVGTDGARYLVRGSADFQVRNGELVGNPEEFVKFGFMQVGDQ